jgi:hypothetical protein
VDHEIKDDGGNLVNIDLIAVKALTTYARGRKVKDDNPQSPTYGQETQGEMRYYIKYEYNSTFFKLQSFTLEKERDHELNKVKELRKSLFRSSMKILGGG